VGIAVTDLDAAIEMYETAFGMTCVHTEVNEEQGVREAMLEVGSSGRTSSCWRRCRPTARSGGSWSAAARHPADGLPGPVGRRGQRHLRAQGMRLLYDEAKRGTAAAG
jgi:methylmalonyl-CoA/ethylmalonyl-CoA epimerase